MGGLAHFPDLYALDDVSVVAWATAAQSATAKTCLCIGVCAERICLLVLVNLINYRIRNFRAFKDRKIKSKPLL